MDYMDDRTWLNLAGVHPQLFAVFVAAYVKGPFDFVVTEGKRSHARQRELFREGKTWTLNSRHLDGQAVDVALLDPLGRVTWDVELYRDFWMNQVRPTAAKLGVGIQWGGDWKQVDACHFQLA